jgi:hypothetical protein
VNDFNEITGVISIVGGFILTWHDFRLSWTPSSYGGLQFLPIQKKKLWIPNIFLIDPANKMEAVGDDDFIGRITYTGHVSWTPGGLIQTLCEVDMYKFPFDTQTCGFTLALWGYSPLEAKLVPYTNMTTADTLYYSPNSQWTLKGTVMKQTTLGDYDNLLKIELILKRKSLYFVINMLAPILLLSLLNPLVFVLPIDSGERVSYAITIFLSFAVFMTLLSDNIPKSSEPMALMSYFLIITMCMSTLVCVLSIVTMRFHFKDSDSEVSSKAAFVLYVLQFRFLCHFCRRRRQKTKVDDNLNSKVRFVKSKYDNEEKTLDQEGERKMTWKVLADGYDKTMAYYFYVIAFLQWIILGGTLAS